MFGKSPTASIALVQKLREEKILKHRKLRTDNTVMEADIHHPTDAGLLQDGVKEITRTVRKIKKQCLMPWKDFKTEPGKLRSTSFP
ncbi:hypothetical protein SAMN04488025_1261 [Planifilum fulgidum]|uniref:Uncharacterized protein n=1 Tax=Planifilum fulgidum TaxID=201973 RepID=A0A1I2QVY7_9BACL|nr:hypothetical protein SAMN04488025_1261 [Planifilum fulgidum]